MSYQQNENLFTLLATSLPIASNYQGVFI